MSNGHYDTVGRPLPKLLSLELFNPETDDKDSDSSGMSSPDSIESVVENRMKSPMHTSKFPFPPSSLSIGSTTTSKTKTSSSSKSLLEAAADVANSLDEAVEKVNNIIGCSVILIPPLLQVIKSSPRARRRQLKTGDVMSVIHRQFDTEPLLPKNDLGIEPTWDEDCRKHLSEFADNLSQKLMREIDHYNEQKRERVGTPSVEHIDDPYINRLSEELNDLSKLSEEIQRQNEYLAQLSVSDSFYGKIQCDKCKLKHCKCAENDKTTGPSGRRGDVGEVVSWCEKVETCEVAARVASTTSLPAAVVKSESKENRVVEKNGLKKGSSIESCESEKGKNSPK